MSKIQVTAFALASLLALAGCAASSTGTATEPTGAAPSAPAADAPSETPATEPAEAPSEPEAPALTVAQEQAVKSAESYLEMSGFSEKGLIDQLTSDYGEGFSKKDAVFAVAYLHPNWNAEAVESAKSYMEMGGFSRKGLIDQLSSAYGEKFTQAQATHAANAVGL